MQTKKIVSPMLLALLLAGLIGNIIPFNINIKTITASSDDLIDVGVAGELQSVLYAEDFESGFEKWNTHMEGDDSLTKNDTYPAHTGSYCLGINASNGKAWINSTGIWEFTPTYPLKLSHFFATNITTSYVLLGALKDTVINYALFNVMYLKDTGIKFSYTLANLTVKYTDVYDLSEPNYWTNLTITSTADGDETSDYIRLYINETLTCEVTNADLKAFTALEVGNIGDGYSASTVGQLYIDNFVLETLYAENPSESGKGSKYTLDYLKHVIPLTVTEISESQISSQISGFDVFVLDDVQHLSSSSNTSIVDWVNNGGKLIITGQSGRILDGILQTTYPFETILGLSTTDFESTFIASSQVFNASFGMWITDFNWIQGWSPYGLQYYKEIPQRYVANVSLNGGTLIASFTNKSETVNAIDVVYDTYGSGEVLFINVDYFNRLLWQIFTVADAGGDGEREPSAIIRNHIILMYNCLLHFYDDTILPVITMTPYGFNATYTTHFHIEGKAPPKHPVNDRDTLDDLAYGLLLEFKEEIMDNASYSWMNEYYYNTIITALLDGTSNATNLYNFLTTYGEFGSHSYNHTHFNAWELSNIQRVLESFDANPSLWSAQGWQFPYTSTFYPFVQNNSIGDGGISTPIMSYYQALGDKASYFPVPYILANGSKSYYGYVCSPLESTRFAGNLSDNNFYAQYGLSGGMFPYQHDFAFGVTWYSQMKGLLDYIETRNDILVMKFSDYHDWIKKRYQITYNSYLINGESITIGLSVPQELNGVTFNFLNIGSNIISDITLDSNQVPLLSQSKKRLIIGKLTAGSHTITITFGSSNPTCLHFQSVESTDARKPYVTDISLTLNQLSFVVSASSGVTSTTQVYCGNKGEPKRVTDATSWSYDSGTKICTITVTHSSSQEVTLDWSEGAASGLFNLMISVLKDGYPAQAVINLKGENRSIYGLTNYQLPYGTYTITVYCDGAVQTKQIGMFANNNVGFNFTSAREPLDRRWLAVPILIILAVALFTFLRKKH